MSGRRDDSREFRTYDGVVVPDSFHDFYIGAGQVAGVLIGRLFVAIQLSPVKAVGRGASAGQQLKVGTAFA
jgi:hypothetical protein